MKIGCHCGETILDSADDLPHKGHLIPDQRWFAIFDALDAQVIVPLSAGAIDPVKASHLSRSIINRAARLMYQCRACGRLYINGQQGGSLECYVPSDDATSKGILGE